MAKVSVRSGVNIGRVIRKIAYTVIILWVGGTILTEVGSAMEGYCSPFFKGLSLIGWELENGSDATTTLGAGEVDAACENVASEVVITDTSGVGVLVVVGLFAIASIVLEFVNFKM